MKNYKSPNAVAQSYRVQARKALKALPANYTIVSGFRDTLPGDIFWDAKTQKWDTTFEPQESKPVSWYFAVAAR
jgi:hypothetical protein